MGERSRQSEALRDWTKLVGLPVAHHSMSCPAAQTRVPAQELLLPKLECRDVIACATLLPGLLFHWFFDAQSGTLGVFFRF